MQICLYSSTISRKPAKYVLLQRPQYLKNFLLFICLVVWTYDSICRYDVHRMKSSVPFQARRGIFPTWPSDELLDWGETANVVYKIISLSSKSKRFPWCASSLFCGKNISLGNTFISRTVVLVVAYSALESFW